MYVKSHHSIEQLEDLAVGETNVTKHLKLRALVLAKRGWVASRIAEALGKSARTIQQWVGDYNRQQLNGLIDHRGGNHRYLTDDQEAQLSAHLDETGADSERGVRHAAELIPWIELACSPKHAPSVMRVSTGKYAQVTFYVRQQKTQTEAAQARTNH